MSGLSPVPSVEVERSAKDPSNSLCVDYAETKIPQN
jgi:hypothetical protein